LILGLAALGIVVSAAMQQAPPPRPPDLPVTRLEGADGNRLAGQAPAGQGTGQLPQLPVTRLDDRSPAADLDGPRTLSLSLSQPLPLRDMLLLLVRDTPFSIVTDDRVDGTFSGELKDLTMRHALEAVLFPRDLDYDLRDSLIRVFPRKPATRLFDVNHLNVRRSADRSLESSTALSGNTPATQISTTASADLFDELEKGVDRLLSASGRAHVDRAAGLVQVTDFSERLDEIGVYVEAVQLRATRQVRIEARIFEVTFNDAAARSIDWTDIAARAGAGLRPTAPGAAGLRITDFDALMSAFAAQGTLRMIAAPHLVAMNNEPALMRVGTQAVHFVPLADGQASTPATTMQGLTLLVTAQVAADGIVQLHVAPSYAEKSADAKGPRGMTAPVLDVSDADTLVRVQDGETVIVSGFLKDRTRTTQGTGLAGFFGAQSHETVKSELVILLTPTVVGPGAVVHPGSR
jgi:MSHA biogenesis protein MshL